MRIITKEELAAIIERHGKWLRYEEGGERADLSGSDLRYSNLSGSNLSGSNLSGSDLSDSNLSGSNLSGSNLSGSNLSGSVGSNARVDSLQIPPYKIIVLDKQIVWGGCTKKTVQEWLEYEGSELSPDDQRYLESITKPFIRMACED